MAGHITILPWHYSAIIQGTWVVSINSLSIFNGIFLNTSVAQNDRVDFKVYLEAGTYTFIVMGATYSTYGILTLLFDDSSQGTIDLYSAGAVYNVLKSIVNITVTTAGLKTISLKMATKNASSTGYGLGVCSMVLFRTA